MTAFKSIAAAILSAAFAGAAYAQSSTFTAKVAGEPAQSRIIALNTMWNCSGDTCIAHPDHAVSVRACRQFAHQARVQVTAYGNEQQQLSADELARCNADQPVQQARN
ncbi:MAG: hypothetical protein JSS00_01215 [Proteobacteria bacterium]|nr:hypothetical protein [Pseudomonadota bacterium]